MIYTTNNKKYIHGEREPQQIALNISKCKRHHFEKSAVWGCNLNEHHLLFFIQSGSLILNGNLIQKGNFVYIAKYANYQFTVDTAACVTELAFDYSDKISLFDKPLRIMEAPLDLQECMNKIYFSDYFSNCLPGLKEGLLLVILNTLNSLCNSYSGELNRYQKCCEWIEQHAKCNITAEDAATAMDCTLAHLNRTVKKYSGKCLSTLICERRILEIKQLIKNRRIKTAEAAAILGFDSPELMRKFFKYHTGMSLREYREEI